jgi:hypothetical protein
MTQSETNIWRSIMLSLSPLGVRLFRNQRYKGQIVQRGKISGSWADCGVGGDGGADLIGYTIVTITQEMVGRTIPIFTAFEVKTKKGRPTEDQLRFLQAIRMSGGIAEVVMSAEEAEEACRIWKL